MKENRIWIAYGVYVLVVLTLAYFFSGCASEAPKAMSVMGECRALCRGDVQQFIDDTTQCICRERQESGRVAR